MNEYGVEAPFIDVSMPPAWTNSVILLFYYFIILLLL